MKFIKGDLIDAVLSDSPESPQLMMHVCNNQGVMGSGIALSVKNRIPAAYEAYRSFYQKAGQPIALGTISISDNVINLHAQSGYGRGIRHLNYEALYVALEKAASHIRASRLTRVGVPYLMGSDRAGGDWNIVSAMLNAIFTSEQNSHISLLVYNLN